MALTKIKTSGIADNAITNAKMADDAIDSAVFADASIDNVHVATGLDAVKLADGTVTNTEFQYINTLSSNAQTQISAKSPIASPTFTGNFTSVGIDDNADATAITIDSSERVGIGITSSITDPLHVKTTAVETRISLESSTGKGAIGAEDGDKFGILNYGTSTPFIIDSSGNIGVGATPFNLYANYTGLTIGGNSILYSETGTQASASFRIAQNVREEVTTGDWTYVSTDEASVLNMGSGNFYFSTAPSGTANADATLTERMRITQAGNVGIGTSSPAHLLEIYKDGGVADLMVKGANGGASASIIIAGYTSSTLSLYRNVSDPTWELERISGSNDLKLEAVGSHDSETGAGNVM